MRLRHATTAQDDKSEALASAFVQSSSMSPSHDGNGEIDNFVKEFKVLRKVYHKRVMWGERWAVGQITWRDDWAMAFVSYPTFTHFDTKKLSVLLKWMVVARTGGMRWRSQWNQPRGKWLCCRVDFRATTHYWSAKNIIEFMISPILQS